MRILIRPIDDGFFVGPTINVVTRYSEEGVKCGHPSRENREPWVVDPHHDQQDRSHNAVDDRRDRTRVQSLLDAINREETRRDIACMAMFEKAQGQTKQVPK